MVAGAGGAITGAQDGLLFGAVGGNEPSEGGLFHCGPDVFLIVFPHVAGGGTAP